MNVLITVSLHFETALANRISDGFKSSSKLEPEMLALVSYITVRNSVQVVVTLQFVFLWNSDVARGGGSRGLPCQLNPKVQRIL